MTPVEKATLEAIIASDFHEEKGDPVWTDVLMHKDFSCNQIFGCLPRLQEKGLVQIVGSGRETTVSITETGYMALGK